VTFQPSLSEEMKAKLLVDYSDGFKLIELAPRYGVSVRTVNRILADAEVPYARNHKRKRELKPCGTRAAYRRHLRKGEYPCIPCLDANNNETYNRRTK
jgi:hypothetical protein